MIVPIFTLRHARSIANGHNKHVYDTMKDENVPLSVEGIEYFHTQAPKIIENFGEDISHINVFCSPYLRTVQTFDLLELYLKKADININYFEVNPLLIEHTCYYFYNSIDFPQYVNELKEYGSKFYFKYKNGENGVDCYQRVTTFFNYLRNFDLSTKISGPILLVTHGFLMNVIDMYINKLTPSEFDKMKTPQNCEIKEYNINL